MVTGAHVSFVDDGGEERAPQGDGFGDSKAFRAAKHRAKVAEARRAYDVA